MLCDHHAYTHHNEDHVSDGKRTKAIIAIAAQPLKKIATEAIHITCRLESLFAAMKGEPQPYDELPRCGAATHYLADVVTAVES